MRGSVKLTHQYFISRPFFKPGWHFFKPVTCPLRSRVFRLTEASFGETVKTSNDSGELCNRAASMIPDMMKPFITQSLKFSIILHSFVSTLLWYVDMSFREFRVTALFFGCSQTGSTKGHPPWHLTVWQLL